MRFETKAGLEAPVLLKELVKTDSQIKVVTDALGVSRITTLRWLRGDAVVAGNWLHTRHRAIPNLDLSVHSYDLNQFIRNHYQSQLNFSALMDTTPQAVNRWVAKGWIVTNGYIYTPHLNLGMYSKFKLSQLETPEQAKEEKPKAASKAKADKAKADKAKADKAKAIAKAQADKTKAAAKGTVKSSKRKGQVNEI